MNEEVFNEPAKVENDQNNELLKVGNIKKLKTGTGHLKVPCSNEIELK